MAQCDTYPPAATAAKDAFEAAFPPSKQPEAIVFCKEEITSVSFWNHSVPVFLKCLKALRHTVVALFARNKLCLSCHTQST